MARGKRSIEVKFYTEPSVPMAAFVLKVLERHGWPRLLAERLTGEMRAQVVYEIGGCLFSRYKENLFLFRRLVTGVAREKPSSGAARKLGRSLCRNNFLRGVDVEDSLSDSKAFSLLRLADSRWGERFVESLSHNLEGNRFHPEAISFRIHWPQTIELAALKAANSRTTVRLGIEFDSWVHAEGWKWGIQDGDYDALSSQCLLEDRKVDLAFAKFGYQSFGGFLDRGPFRYERSEKVHGAIGLGIFSELEAILLKP